MTATRTAHARQTVAAFAMALTMSLGLLSAMGQIADRYHAGERIAQGAAPSVQQVVSVASAPRS